MDAKENSTENQVEVLEEGKVDPVNDGIRAQPNSYQEVFIEDINTTASDPISGKLEMVGNLITMDVNDIVEHGNLVGNVTDDRADREMNEDGYADCISDSGLEKLLKRKNKSHSVRLLHWVRARPSRLDL